MNTFRRITAFVMSTVIIISLMTFIPSMALESATEINDMKTDDLTNPVGIDTNPAFSWKLSSDVIGQKQTAYQIIIKDDSDVVWDSGKVESSDTVAIPYAGKALEASTEYSWTVTVWDKDGVACTSDVATFETGLLDNDAWDSTEWISVDGGADIYSNDSLHYTVESDVYITKHGNNNNACIYFNKLNDYNFFMWQVQYTPSNGIVKLRPHVKFAGSYSVLTTSDVTAYVDDIENIYSTPQALKIDVTKSGVITYFNGVKVSEFAAADLKIAISDRIEKFGLRAHGDTTTVDSFKVTDITSDTVIIDTDFSDNRVYFEGTTVASGKATFVNNGGSGVTETFANLSGYTPAESFGKLDYTIESDITVKKFVHSTAGNITKFSLAFNGLNSKNVYMWHFAVENNKLTFTPHVRNLGTWKKPVGSIDVTKYIKGDFADILETAQSVKIHVSNGGVETYLNGYLVSVVSASQLTHFPVLNYIANTGVRVYNESGVVDNYKITDYSTDKNGIVVCDYNFDDGVNPFVGGTAENGGIFFTSANSESIWFMKQNTRELRYSVEADMTVSSQAIGLIFGARDAKNGYMWQLVKNSDGTVSVKPHSLVEGTFGAYSSYITAVNVSDIENTPAKLRIDVTPYSFTTYVNGELVNTVPAGIKNAKGSVGITSLLGKIGIRASSNEIGTVDNIKVTDYTRNSNGDIVYNCNFDDGSNPFISGEIKDGSLYIDNIGAILLEDRASHFYKNFESKKPVSAKLYTTGSGVYNVFVNGVSVGDDELKPGFTEPTKRRFYHTFDVTDLIKDGQNTLSAISTGGWWTDAIVEYVGKKPAFRAKLILNYDDGTQTVIGTDTTWKGDYNSPVRYADIYTGEVFDARIVSDYNGKNVIVNTEFTGIIEAHKGARTKIRSDLERKVKSVTVYEGVVNETDKQYGNVNVVATYDSGSFTLSSGQTAVVDFGQNFSGWEAFSVSGERGTAVTIRHAEALNDNNGLISRGNDGPEGSVYTANLRTAKAITKYTLSGDGEEYYHPSYTYFGFRYIEITATADVTFGEICGQVLTSVETDSGSIVTSDSDVNQLISNSVWGMYSNYVSVPTDCPQRDERAGWTADTQVFSGTAAYLTESSKTFLSKWLQDLRDNQMADGQYAGAAPSCRNGKNYGAFGWADAGIIVPYNIYSMYGDTELISEHYESMQSYIDGYLSTTNKTGAKHTYGDWLSIEENSGDVKRILGVAFYAWDALMMSEMATALGKTDDAERYMQLYLTEKEYFIEQFVNDDGTLCDSRQSSCLYALYLDLLPDENSVEKVTEQLVNNIESAGNKLQTGFLGTAIILPTLTKIGRSDIAYKILLQHDYPSWLYTVDQGATTMWERWNSYTFEDGFGEVSMNSFNHYAYGAVTEWMFRYMAGIQSNKGFSDFVLAPTPDKSITSVSSVYDSAFGEIKSAWDYNGEEWKYTATVPANTTATVKIPTDNISSIYVNGKSYIDATIESDGLMFSNYDNGVAIFEAVASTFTITVNDKLTGAAGPKSTYTFDLSTGILTVEGTGLVWSGVPSANKLDVKEIVFADGITEICDMTYSGYYNIEKVTLPEGLKVIGNWNFYGTKLTEISLPSTLTKVGDYAFGNSVLESVEFADTRAVWNNVTIGQYNTVLDKVVCKGEIFDYPTQTTVWVYDGVDTIYLSGTGYITSFTDGNEMIPDDIAANIKHIVLDETIAGFGAYTFANMPNLVDVTGGENMRYIGNCAFKNCKELTTVEFTSAQYFGAINYGAFMYCESLESITLSEYISVIYGAAFRGCISLKEVVVPAKVETIGEYVFWNCIGLETLEIKGAKTLGAGSVQNCTALKSVVLPDTLLLVGGYAFYGANPDMEVSFNNWDICTIGAGNSVLTNAK